MSSSHSTPSIPQQVVILWVPDLLNPLRLKEAGIAWSQLKLPNLQTLCAKADVFSAKVFNEQAFFKQANYLFHQNSDLPLAAISAHYDLPNFDGNVDAKAFWLRVDPAQMVPDRDTLVLIPPEDLAITPAESQALMNSFNAHFAQDGVQLEYGAPQRWYLRMVQPIDLTTTSLMDAAYQSVNLRYPKGNAASYWHPLMNEVQMLFYTHPVNEARREQNRPEINSIWVWGEGQLHNAAGQSVLKPRPDAAIWSHNPYLNGLASACQAHAKPSLANYQAWSNATQAQNINNSDAEPIKHHLIYHDALSDSLANLTQAQWIDAVQQLDHDWLEGILNGLREQRLQSVLLVLGDGRQYHVQPKHLKRFWRLKKSLKQF